MGETGKYLPQAVLQAQAEDDAARRHRDGHRLFHLPSVLHPGAAGGDRAQGIGECRAAAGRAEGLEAHSEVCASFVRHLCVRFPFDRRISNC